MLGQSVFLTVGGPEGGVVGGGVNMLVYVKDRTPVLATNYLKLVYFVPKTGLQYCREG